MPSALSKMNDHNEIEARKMWRNCVRSGVSILDLLLSPAGISKQGRFRQKVLHAHTVPAQQ